MQRIARCTLAAVSITLVLVGCQDGTGPRSTSPIASPPTPPALSPAEGKPAPLVLHIIAPQATDPAINVALADHYVWLDTTARGNPKLLVFMPGARGRPVQSQFVEQEAARLGYHVIGLMYQNDVPVDSICKGVADRDCSGNLRLEILDGIDRSALTEVTPANGIDNRLAKVLAYLADQFPDEGWSRFVEDDGTPKWSQIAVAGWSQGAGQAALIGKLRHVNRVVMFSGPPDARVPEEVDPWIFIGVTPAAKYFALFHQREHPVAGIRANLTALDMERFGAPVMVELNEPPYGDTHILTTDLLPQSGSYARPAPHQSTARDNNTPLGLDGTPLLRAAWRYLLGEPPPEGAETVAAHGTP